MLFRLDEVVDPHSLTEILLEVMPTCNRPVQQGILELLPELVLEQDCEVCVSPSALPHFRALLQWTKCGEDCNTAA